MKNAANRTNIAATRKMRSSEFHFGTEEIMHALSKCKPEAREELLQIINEGGPILQNIFRAYQINMSLLSMHQEFLEKDQARADQVEPEKRRLRRIAKRLEGAEEELNEIYAQERKLLRGVGGFLDLREYRKALYDLDIYPNTWVGIVGHFFNEKSIEYRLAQLLDKKTRVKSKFNRIQRQFDQACRKFVMREIAEDSWE